MREGFVNPGARFCVPEAAAVRRPRVKPPIPCLTRYRAESRPMAVTGALLGRSACCWAGAGDGDAGEGNTKWGRGRPVGTRQAREGSELGPETAGPAMGVWELSCASRGSLITLCAPAPMVAASLKSSPLQSPASTSLGGWVPGGPVCLPL